MTGQIDSFWINQDIKVAIDRPSTFASGKNSIIIFFALPNGNTIEQTMGKKMKPGDDWHFDIQHIKAQTGFLRNKLRKKNVIVIYVGNQYHSWPLWKQQHDNFSMLIPHLVDSLASLIPGKKNAIYLNGHSGGGSFIFGYLAGVEMVPENIKRISFLDSNYGYDHLYYPGLLNWLKTVKGAALNVFAYNDSIALYNGKPVVSATGGTWFRSHQMLKDFQQGFTFTREDTDSLVIYKSRDKRIQFYFKNNPDRGIYHTQQVALNGFIHSVLCGTPHDSRKYHYYSIRAYNNYIE